MKAIIGFTFFLLFLAGIMFATLLDRRNTLENMPGGGASLTGITWRPVSVGDASVAGDAGMFVTISVDGAINGSGGCNTFRASLKQTESRLSIDPLVATRNVCAKQIMAIEDDFLEALKKTRHIQSDGKSMQLLDKNDNVLMNLVED